MLTPLERELLESYRELRKQINAGGIVAHSEGGVQAIFRLSDAIEPLAARAESREQPADTSERK